jgi:hypothetical protein
MVLIIPADCYPFLFSLSADTLEEIMHHALRSSVYRPTQAAQRNVITTLFLTSSGFNGVYTFEVLSIDSNSSLWIMNVRQ